MPNRVGGSKENGSAEDRAPPPRMPPSLGEDAPLLARDCLALHCRTPLQIRATTVEQGLEP